MYSFIFYVVAISLQVSGALQLLLSFVSTKRDNVIRNFIGKGIISRDNNTKIIDYDKKAYKQVFKSAYLNKFSFIYIFLGYLLGIWGTIEKESKSKATIFIILTTIVILTISNLLITLYVKKSKKVNREITNEDLERLQIQPDIENISNEEIEKLFN